MCHVSECNQLDRPFALPVSVQLELSDPCLALIATLLNSRKASPCPYTPSSSPLSLEPHPLQPEHQHFLQVPKLGQYGVEA